MKRFAALTLVLLLLLAAMLAVTGAMPWGLPTEALVAGPAERADGSVLTAENRLLTSRVYTLRDGQLTEIYEELRCQGQETREIIRVAADETDTYFLREYQDDGSRELLRLEGGAAFPLWRGDFDEPLNVTGLTARSGAVWITGVSDAGAIHVYEFTEAGGLAISLVIPSWWLWDTVTAEFDGEQIRATTELGEHCFMTPQGKKTYTDDAAETPAPVVTAEGENWLFCKQDLLTAAFLLWLVLGASGIVTCLVLTRANRLSTRLTALGCELLFLALLATVAAVPVLTLRTATPPAALQAAKAAAAAAAVIWLAGLVLLRLLSHRMTAKVTGLTRQMEDVADGRVTVQEVSSGRDELHRMDRSMQELCTSLSIRNYEIDCTIRSYQRFVPQKLTELLDRANLAEVNLGDSRRITGNVGLFSVGNRAEARAQLEDDAFVDFINYSFGIFQECIQENRGCMISSALKLSAMDALFMDSPADGVRAGLDFLGRVRERQETGIPAPRPLLLLHRASFLYGIAGREERLFPYVSSSEMDFLSGFARNFHETGARIVTTEAYWKQLQGSGFTGRYIGFVSDGEKDAYKLYEILDAYPELERKLRQGYDHRFQEAINLFYHDDFFLARNLFSTLLRACPEDGIVRWYLFACEHFFNQEGDFEADYRLFGVNEV